MIKWLIIVTIIFSSIWIFYKNEFPEFVRDSKFADVVNTFIYPIENAVDKQFPEARKNIKKPVFYQLNYQKILDFRLQNESGDRQVVYFFYDPETFGSRLIVNSLNRLTKSHPYTKYKVDYLFVAVTDKPESFQDFLKQFFKINFVPYYISRSDFSPVIMMFERAGLAATADLPRAVFKRNTQNSYLEMQSGFFTKGRLEVLIEQKI